MAGASHVFGKGLRPDASGDTLIESGTWDKVQQDAVGTLYFLKGDRMLAVQYMTARVGWFDAVALSKIALDRLAAQ